MRTLNALSPDAILGLAPVDLPSQRDARYQGGGFHLSLETDFTLDEQEIVRRQYSQLKDLFGLTDPVLSYNPLQRSALEAFAGANELIPIEEQLLQMIDESNGRRDPQVNKALSKLAGGAFASICEYVLLLQAGGFEDEYMQTLHYLSGDHMKIMRSLLEDLDRQALSRDKTRHHHSIDLLVEKWRTTAYRVFERKLDVQFTNHFVGDVAERCLEFAEIDLLFYHLANNCTRYSSDRVLQIHVIKTPNGQNLRWVFSNTVNAEQRTKLETILKSNRSLFEHGVSSDGTGHGHGLGIVAESVAHAYGIESTAEAEKKGYFGVKLQDNLFILWFHWPTVD